MKQTELQTPAYKNLLAQFKTHLTTVNYATSTVKGAINATTDYLQHLEEQNIELQKITSVEVKIYFDFLQSRPNKKTGIGLSLRYLQKIRSCLTMFYEFLELTQESCTEQGRSAYNQPVFPQFKATRYIPGVLTKQQIENLFKACDETLLGKRNKALLAVYYGSGLRRQEGTNLNVEDVDLNKGLLFISKTKTKRQRNVPISTLMQVILEDYLFNVREKLIDKESSQNALLVTERGERLSGESVVYIVQKLATSCKITTKVNPHMLRHSIATHLLQSGMKFESIAQFLGHRSLDSTQLYTHLAQQDTRLYY